MRHGSTATPPDAAIQTSQRASRRASASARKPTESAPITPPIPITMPSWVPNSPGDRSNMRSMNAGDQVSMAYEVIE